MRAAKLRQKGRSLLAFPDDYVVVDLETTGMSAANADIIEIACVRYRDNVEVERLVTLVKPDGGAWVPPFITGLTGIASSTLVGAPFFREVADEVWEFLRGETILGHNVNFDVNFLYDAFEKYARSFGSDAGTNGRAMTLDNDFVDTYRLARRILPELRRRRLVDLCAFYHIDSIHHRALADCDSTWKAFMRLRQTAKERGIVFPSVGDVGEGPRLF